MSLVVEWHHRDSSCPPLVFIQDMLSGASKGSQMNQIVFPDIFDLEKAKFWTISAKVNHSGCSANNKPKMAYSHDAFPRH